MKKVTEKKTVLPTSSGSKILALFAAACLILTSNAHSQYYFGRNKVQYNNFTWHVLQTEHFDIYYYPEMQQIAEIGAAYAEETYTILENKFNHNVGRKIPLIFYASHAHFQQTNTIPFLLPEGVGGIGPAAGEELLEAQLLAQGAAGPDCVGLTPFGRGDAGGRWSSAGTRPG